MDLLINELKQIFTEAIEKIAPELENPPVTVQFTKNSELGEFQCNSAMALSRVLKKNPREIADMLVEAVEKGAVIQSMSVAGPGFINIRLSRKKVSHYISSVGGKDFFPAQTGAGPIIIDYSAPNIAKRMHIGHLRSTIIGDSLKRIYRYLGHSVVGDNHIGDWGTQFGKLIVGYHKWLDKDAFENNPIEELERIYVKFEQESANDPSLIETARAERTKLQSGDEENVKLWQTFIDESLAEYEKIYSMLDISFDTHRGESYYHKMMPEIVEILKKEELAEESEGALVVFFDEKDHLHPCIVQTNDGAYVYSTSDLACIKNRSEEYSPHKIIYVTDDRQITHFKQVFKIAERLGWNAQREHVYFGIMKFTDGHFSSRKGNVIYLSHLLGEAVKRAFQIVTEKNPDLPEEDRKNIADVVGTGAVKYFDLSQNRTSNIVFDWDKILSFEGNTSPYLQYVYARIQSLIKKSGISEFTPDFDNLEPTKGEEKLIHNLLKFPDAVLQAGESSRPNIIADYIYELSQSFNSFYNSHPILKDEEEKKMYRLFLCSKTAEIIETGLGLLGIKVVDRM